jgi:hypothetical protein
MRSRISYVEACLVSIALLIAPCVGACSSDSSDNPAPATNGDGGTSSAPSNVALDYKGTAATVDLNKLTQQDYKGEKVVSLSKVWEASALTGDLAKLEFDFEGDDGFRPSSKDRCKTKIAGTQLGQGYVLPDVRSLVWDDALGLPGCYAVKGVAKIYATDKP